MIVVKVSIPYTDNFSYSYFLINSIKVNIKPITVMMNIPLNIGPNPPILISGIE